MTSRDPSIDSQSATTADRGDPTVSRIVETWCRLDHLRAVLANDHGVVEATKPLRALVAASLVLMLPEPATVSRSRGTLDPDLLHAFGAIGRGLAEGGGSPTLAASTIDSLLAAIEEHVPAFSAATAPGAAAVRAVAAHARAAVFESFTHVVRGALHDEELRRWEYPSCVVPLSDGSFAIAAGHPVDDEEALAGWAARVAHGVALSGVRRAIVAGPDKAVRAVLDALDLAGVSAVEVKGAPPTPSGRERRAR
jgi:hypothetical protein